jgi:hypothetical protein
VVEKGQLTTLDVGKLVEKHNQIAAEIVSRHATPERFKLV